MTGIAERVSVPGEPAEPVARPRFWRGADFQTVARWLTIGAAAGGLSGFVIGGIGGRLAMLLLRVTSDDSVRGIESDDGFIIGRFDFVSTLQLLGVTTLMGCIVGLIIVAGRPFFPKRGMPFAWAAAGAIVGGGILIHHDGVDFTVLEPHWLAIALFIAIPAAGAGLIAWLVELYPGFWVRNRVLTALACVFVLPVIIFFPIALAAILVGAIFWLFMQVPKLRTFPAWRPARIAAIVVFGLIVALGAVDLTSDVTTIL